ncbi:ABC transporter substrate-binding protein [Bradyrhizobium sp. 172]|uniref:ABC transporter substrate-binding protein n=2 Tax=unclassified Bradyrhizobium TaxID=2631580 RepID=UPI001FFEE4E2|nr:ABC transporter substrate-binding protein [Bradyrhizobium sp. 172]UPK00062.1 ABC transporter substrate-binding protein [Bradyrhizobium sp. 172]
MRRRDFIRLVGLSPALPLAARAQQGATSGRAAKIGVLWHAGSAEEEKVYLDSLTKAFDDLGYVQGKNVVFLHRFPAEQLEQFRSLAKELVESNADVIVAITAPGAIVLKQITSTIPVVFAIVPDPVGTALVASLAHPGGNLTGLSVIGTDLSGKRLSLLKEAVPSLSRVALLLDRSMDPNTSKHNVSAYSKAAEAIGVVLHPFEVATPDAIDGAFSAAAADGCDGAIVVGSMLANERPQVGASALAHRIAGVSIWAEKVRFGLLMSYGQDVSEILVKTAGYVDKILKGAKPADLPVEQPTRLKLVINLKVANALGLTIPPTLLASADEVIE